mmetsp:Transcript_59562/g.156999  ORF Transcript_59562/g.156999 Transcript_59562/m.156999 type:complete len:86 (+) Transcript_59562:286-543(+)
MRELKFVKRDKSAGRSLSSTKGSLSSPRSSSRSKIRRVAPRTTHVPPLALPLSPSLLHPAPSFPPNPLCMLRLQLLPFMLVLQHC